MGGNYYNLGGDTRGEDRLPFLESGIVCPRAIMVRDNQILSPPDCNDYIIMG